MAAADVLERAPRSSSTNAAFLVMRAKVSLAQGRPEDAIRFLGTAMQLGPATAEMQHQLGRALLAQGSDEAARNVLTKAVSMDPSCSGAHLALAGLLARRQPPDLALARWHYGRALQTGARRDATVERLLGIPASATNAAPAAVRTVPAQPATSPAPKPAP
jgi:predicted Zn-dependent protease